MIDTSELTEFLRYGSRFTSKQFALLHRNLAMESVNALNKNPTTGHSVLTDLMISALAERAISFGAASFQVHAESAMERVQQLQILADMLWKRGVKVDDYDWMAAKAHLIANDQLPLCADLRTLFSTEMAPLLVEEVIVYDLDEPLASMLSTIETRIHSFANRVSNPDILYQSADDVFRLAEEIEAEPTHYQMDHDGAVYHYLARKWSHVYEMLIVSVFNQSHMGYFDRSELQAVRAVAMALENKGARPLSPLSAHIVSFANFYELFLGIIIDVLTIFARAKAGAKISKHPLMKRWLYREGGAIDRVWHPVYGADRLRSRHFAFQPTESQ